MGDLPTRVDFFGVARRWIASVPNTRISPEMVDVEGSDVNLVVGQSSIMAEALSASWARCMRALFVDTAVGDELDRIAYDRFGITRKPANAATVDLVLARPSAGAGGGTVPAGARVTTAAGAIFSLEVDVTFGALDLSRPATAVAQVVGPEQNVPAGALASFLDGPFDPTIAVTNPARAAGGTVAETDPQFRGRIRSFYLTLRRGTVGAIQFAATTIPGVSVSTAFEIENPGSALPAGAVQLIVADDDGAASSAMLQAVTDVLLQFRCGGIPVFVSGGNVVFSTAIFKLAFATGVDTVRASSEVRAMAVAVAEFLNPGQPLLRSLMVAAARAVPGVIVGDGAVVAPAGDVIPPDNRTILRLRPSDVSFA